MKTIRTITLKDAWAKEALAGVKSPSTNPNGVAAAVNVGGPGRNPVGAGFLGVAFPRQLVPRNPASAGLMDTIPLGLNQAAAAKKLICAPNLLPGFFPIASGTELARILT